MRNLLFIIVDCLRADRCWGDHRSCVTPGIDALVSTSTAFTQALSITSYTVSSFASMLTGAYPYVHGLRGLGGTRRLSKKVRTLPEVLRENGYNTYAEVTGPLMGFLGFDRGFDHFRKRGVQETIYGPWGDSFLSKLKEREYKEPWFLFVHLWEIHDPPRIVLREFDHSYFGRTIYDRALSSLDSKLKEVFEAVGDDAIIVFTGDHGEGICGNRLEGVLKYYHIISDKFSVLRNNRTIAKLRDKIKTSFKRESRKQSTSLPGLEYEHPHGVSLFDYNHRVPLIMRGKEVFEEGKHITYQVNHLDIFPTLASALALKKSIPHYVQGRNLLEVDTIRTEEPLYLELAAEHLPKENWLLGLRNGKYKYIYAPHNKGIPECLYDIRSDSGEQQNLVELKPVEVEYFRGKMKEILKAWEEESQYKEDLSGDEEDAIREQLKSLGYL
jgi:arylsulfatase A-like enzyme